MKITTDYATTSDCYREGRTITVKGLMLHSVGCNQPDPKVFARLWKILMQLIMFAVMVL